ncbi:MAG: hypothetical protein ACXWUL_00180 [Caldimonas sp.]
MASELAPDGAVRLRIDRVELRDVKAVASLASLTAASAALTDVTISLRTAPEGGGPFARLACLRVGELRLGGANVEMAAVPRAAGGMPRKWRLDPLAALDGTVHAEVADAAWMFDADVTIPISAGRIDFNRATVEHVGLDSSMGISRMGIYVDAPNGRTYLYLLSATHVPGARFERRGELLAPWSGDHGAIDLQPFFECLLTGMSIGSPATGARDMAARTRVSAELRLGDGVIGDERNRLVLEGREQGNNRIELASGPSTPGVVVRVPELRARESRVEVAGDAVSTGALAATLSVRLNDVLASSTVSLSIAELTLRDIACGAVEAAARG